MSEDNLKMSIKAMLSENADYSNPEWTIDEDKPKWGPYEIDPDEYDGPAKLSVGTSATSIYEATQTATAKYTTGTAVVMAIKNLDSSNYVDVSWTDVSGTACVSRVRAGAFLVVDGVDTTDDITATASGAAVEIAYFLAQEV